MKSGCGWLQTSADFWLGCSAGTAVYSGSQLQCGHADRTTDMLASETAWHCLGAVSVATAVWAVVVVPVGIWVVDVVAAGVRTVVVVAAGVRTMVVVAACVLTMIVVAAGVVAASDWLSVR